MVAILLFVPCTCPVISAYFFTAIVASGPMGNCCAFLKSVALFEILAFSVRPQSF